MWLLQGLHVHGSYGVYVLAFLWKIALRDSYGKRFVKVWPWQLSSLYLTQLMKSICIAINSENLKEECQQHWTGYQIVYCWKWHYNKTTITEALILITTACISAPTNECFESFNKLLVPFPRLKLFILFLRNQATLERLYNKESFKKSKGQHFIY